MINKKCVAYLTEVISNQGYGVFSIEAVKYKVPCPMCKRFLYNAERCGFFSCKYRFEGVQADKTKREGSGEAGDDKYTALPEGESVKWKYLRLQVIALKD